ncbi:MAG TPA: hypothetical protein VJ783_24875 [Pirellulales bacterium]|nr:hypothetical protein [Pirellulales bacterium]
MTDVNPYASPVEFGSAAIERSRVRGVGAWVVMSFVLDALVIYTSLPELTWAYYAIAAALRFALPLAALYAVWRRRSTGRWILVGVFSMRAAGSLLILATYFSHGIPSLPLLVTPPILKYIIQALIYGAATTWLLFSRTMRRRPEIAGGSNG